MGFSDPTTSVRDARAIVSDLHALLRRAGIAPPYVLVGHSLAGLYTRLYADRYAHDVVGLVLIDPVTEYDEALYEKIAPGRTRLRDVLRKCAADVGKCPLGTTAGMRKSLIAAGCPQAAPADCAVNELVAEEHGRQSFWEDELLEVLAEPTSAAEVRSGQRPYGTLPLIVLSAGHPDTDPGPVTLAQQRAIWIAQGHVHSRIAALSSRGVNLAVDGSGHSIQIDRPSAVISAVNRVVDQARHGLEK
jgi:pimeloyl-ACP methyl ester carboxylesterase